MNFRHFKEYLNAKGKLQEKPEVDSSGDTAPTPPKKPPTPVTKGKNWEANPLAGKPADYTPTTSPAKQQKGTPGLANDGDKKLVYEPETPETIDKEGGKKVSTWPKAATTKEFLDNTKGMSISEFVNFVSQENQTNGQVNPLPYIRFVANLVSKNPNLMESLVREIRRNNGIGILANESLKLPEAVDEVAFMMQDEKFTRRLEKAMRETVEAPASETEFDEPKKKRRTKSIDGNKVDMGNSPVVTTK